MIFSPNRAFSVGAYRDPTYQKCRLLNKVSPSRSYIVKTNRPIAKVFTQTRKRDGEAKKEEEKKNCTDCKNPRLLPTLDRFFVAANA